MQFAAAVRRVGEIVADVLCRVGDAHGDVVIGQEARAGDDVAGDGDVGAGKAEDRVALGSLGEVSVISFSDHLMAGLPVYYRRGFPLTAAISTHR